MLARSFLVLGACVLLAAAACPTANGSAVAEPDAGDGYVFGYDSGTVRLTGPDGSSFELSAAAVPYKIIRGADPAIVTTCGTDLTPVTYVIGSGIARFENMLPQVAEPPLISLFSLATEEQTPGGRTVLIGPDGAVVWEHPNAQLLPPSCGDPAVSPVLAVPCTGTFDQPFGEVPRILALDPETGAETWQADAPSIGTPDDVELLCSGAGYGLLSLQYGYTSFQYIAVNFATGEMSQLYVLSGQPAVVIEQPGAMPIYRHCQAQGTVAEFLVIDDSQGAGVLSFDLARVTTQFKPQQISGPGVIEHNDLPVGGGIASPDAPPYPQSLLPAEYGEHWTIRALVRGKRFLLVTADGASWVKFPADAETSS